MFCPKCGKSDQSPETYCRQCGTFLPDFDKGLRKATSPQEHLKINSVFSVMSAAGSLTLVVLLHYFFTGREGTPILIYATTGFLTTMAAWQIQTFWRTQLLKKHFQQPVNQPADSSHEVLPNSPKITNKLLDEADFENAVPPSVVENSARQFAEKVKSA
jgi:hypothetical protein